MTTSSFRLWRGVFALALVCLISNTAAAQTATHKVRFYFNFGDAVEIELYGNEAPQNVANFLNYVNGTFYDGSYIHRSRAREIIKDEDDNEIVIDTAYFLQGGSYYVPSSGLISDLTSLQIPTDDPVPNEFDPNNGLSNISGTLAAARSSDPDSATSGWFINITNNANSFDSGPYTVFGRVTQGFNFLNAVSFQPLLEDAAPSSANYGVGTAPFIGYDPNPDMPHNGSLFVIIRAVEISPLAGDFDFDGEVGGGDLATWESDFGGQNNIFSGDANGDWDVNGRDVLSWLRNYGNSITLPSSAIAVPEPSTWLLMAGVLLASSRRRTYSRS
jgi:cyclophilin family peptidyl-prolyl cis-trans isomerase